MTPEQRLALINGVMTTMFLVTETFSHRDIGSRLAYLSWAIVSPDRENVFAVNPGDDDDAYFIELLEKTFGPTHDVFKYIIRSPR